MYHLFPIFEPLLNRQAGGHAEIEVGAVARKGGVEIDGLLDGLDHPLALDVIEEHI
nr:hypothetical protein [Rhizobium sullae]